MPNYYTYLIVMALLTYLIRVIPLLLIKEKIKNKFILSLLYYLPPTILAVMTIPSVLYCNGNILSCIVGLLVAVLLSYKGKSLLTVSIICAITTLVISLLVL